MCRGGWLVAPGKLVGVSVHADQPERVGQLRDALDHIPAYDVIGLAAPVGLATVSSPGGRSCDREARKLLGWPRLGAIGSAPGRDALAAGGAASCLDVVTRGALGRIAEVDAEIQPYRQRTIYAVHPELSYFQLNGDRALSFSKRSAEGRAERLELIGRRVLGADRLLEAAGSDTATAVLLLDALAALWTARRVAGKAASRLPVDPQWDDTGLRAEWVR
jgi:predicted RNase H-like nuclease